MAFDLVPIVTAAHSYGWNAARQDDHVLIELPSIGVLL
jgi:hypothetical protein